MLNFVSILCTLFLMICVLLINDLYLNTVVAVVVSTVENKNEKKKEDQ